MYRAGYPRVTHPSAALSEEIARLACVRHAASVHPEPGSNSQNKISSKFYIANDFFANAQNSVAQNKISLLNPLRCYLKISGMVCMAFELFIRTKYICCSVFKVHFLSTSNIITFILYNVNTFFIIFNHFVLTIY